MKTLGGLFVALLFAGLLSAQYRGGFQPYTTGGTGNVLYPGMPANAPGITRATPNVIYPGGGGPRLVVPGTTQPRTSRYGIGTTAAYAYPIYVPSYDPSAYAAPADGAPVQQQVAPNVVVIYPPQGAPAGPPVETAHPTMHVYQAPSEPSADETPATDHYLFAFKDHSIYSAVAYWVDGDTLHYFTNGNTHNQASLSLLDRDLTERLNKESGAELKLPPVKK